VELATRGIELLTTGLKESVQEGAQAQLIEAQTAQVIKSTGGVAGVTADQVQGLADKYSHLTRFSNDSIQSTENLLLTFTNIRGQAFEPATAATLDLAQAMGEDTKSAAIQLGKALGDPAKGYAQLQRVGVTFNQAEIESIKTMQKHGDIAGAQAVILKELQTEFGGSAEAAGKTFAGQLAILNNQMTESKERIGKALIPVLAQLVGVLVPIANILSGVLVGAIQAMGAAFQGVSKIIGGSLAPAFQQFQPSLQILGSLLGTTSRYVQELAGYLVGQLLGGLKGASGGVSTFQNVVNGINDFLKALGPVIASVNGYLFNLVQGIEAGSGPFAKLRGVVLQVSGVISQLGTVVHGFLPVIQQLVENYIRNAANIFGQLAQLLVGTVIPAIATLAGWVARNLVPVLAQLIAFVVSNVLPVFFALENFIVSRLIPIFKGIVNVIIADILPILTSLVSSFKANVLPALEQVWSQIAAKLIPALENLWDKISPILIPALQFVGAVLKAVLVPAFQILGWTLGNIVLPAIILVINIISFLINIIATVIGWVVRLGVAFLNVATNIANAIGNAGGTIQRFVGNVISWFQQLPGKIFQAGVDMIQGFINGIRSLAGGVASTLGNVIRGAIDALPGGAALAHLAGIPGFAAGTGGAPGGLAIVGEGGEPELVVGPHVVGLPRGSGVYPLSALPPGNGGSAPVIHIHIAPELYLDSTPITQSVLRNTPKQVWAATGLRGGL
jgi:phage-related protein